jgi:predicted enzyme related to lactoylglutathione lyase
MGDGASNKSKSGETVMIRTAAIAATVLALMAGPAFSQTASVRDARITAKDRPGVEAASKFYQAVFGAKEITRIDRPTLLESILAFGPTVEAARASPAARIVVMTSDEPIGTVPHLVMTVSDLAAVFKAVGANGGKVVSGPTKTPELPQSTGMINDPAGNRVELVQVDIKK